MTMLQYKIKSLHAMIGNHNSKKTADIRFIILFNMVFTNKMEFSRYEKAIVIYLYKINERQGKFL